MTVISGGENCENAIIYWSVLMCWKTGFVWLGFDKFQFSRLNTNAFYTPVCCKKIRLASIYLLELQVVIIWSAIHLQ